MLFTSNSDNLTDLLGPCFSLRLPFSDRGHIWQPADEHNAILAAITSGNARAARKAMEQHLLSAAGRVGIDFVQP